MNRSPLPTGGLAVSLAEIHISERGICILGREIHKWAREICISSPDLCISSREIGISFFRLHGAKGSAVASCF